MCSSAHCKDRFIGLCILIGISIVGHTPEVLVIAHDVLLVGVS